eukprot:CAMPEP_0172629906 /NCGR_PEP_ID=MMETSP1068-20121228/170537_1 /TAXON_ID=35684 /ORGANISM="Pseudopedinella elastica, Strain CCMP716" /LENGTH=110 /DNA_ID=CAMNT_0013440579 /DNA_START=121 /DNA_END=450 /DNA_ORIENTATION=-
MTGREWTNILLIVLMVMFTTEAFTSHGLRAPGPRKPSATPPIFAARGAARAGDNGPSFASPQLDALEAAVNAVLSDAEGPLQDPGGQPSETRPARAAGDDHDPAAAAAAA